jgi:aspartate-semialdehyde dehydrogenase
MKPGKEGYRVAVVGASSLLGKELVAVLEEGKFPVSRLVTFSTDEDEPELPIIDLRAASKTSVQDGDVNEAELDFAFLAAPLRKLPAFLRSWQDQAGAAHCSVIDLIGEGLGGAAGDREAAAAPPAQQVKVPFLDRLFPATGVESDPAQVFVSAHPAVIVISSLLLRLAARFPLQTAVAQVFGSASESGSRGIEELQRQTMNLLSFQKIPHQVFGAQLAFNLLSRLGRTGTGEAAGLEARLGRQLRQYLGERIPRPALRRFQAPVFYSLGVSLYVETSETVAPEAAAAALAGERVRVRRSTQDAPTLIEVTGSSDILVDRIVSDAAHPTGLWLWAVADNLRLAATNAVELAASLREPARA